jgi:DNA-binding MarR family transcriptional regulator
MSEKHTPKNIGMHYGIAPLIAQTRVAMGNAVDRELLQDPEVRPLEVTSAQFAILANVLQFKVNSACELCERLNYDRGAMSRMLDRLEKKGLIRRVPMAHTRRSLALEVTAEGKAAFPKMEACVARVINRMLEGVTKAQVRDTENVLRKMLANG